MDDKQLAQDFKVMIKADTEHREAALAAGNTRDAQRFEKAIKATQRELGKLKR